MQEEKNNTPISLEDEIKPEKYDYDFKKFESVDGFILDDDLINKFCPVAKKLNLSQESIELLMELALEMSRKQKEGYEKDEEIKLNEKVEEYSKLFKQDLEIPQSNSNKTKEYMNIANSAYSKFATPTLKEIFKMTGLVCHPELIKMFHKIGELTEEDAINYSNEPVKKDLTPAEILYGTKN